MATLSTSFGAFPFDSTTRARIEQWQENILTKATFKERILAEGSEKVKEFFTGREVTLAGQVGGTTQDLARANLGAMIAALSNGTQFLKRYDSRRIPASLSGNIQFSEIVGSSLLVYSWRAKLRSESPFWQATTATTSTFTKTGLTPYTQVLPINNGSAYTRPIIEMTLRSGSELDRTLRLTNLSTGRVFQIHGFDWNQDEKIVVDMDLRYVHDGAGNEIFPDIIEGDWWTLDGNGAISTLQIDHNINALADIDFEVVYFEQFTSY